MTQFTKPRLQIACVCASNLNRSMAAHTRLVENNIDSVHSYGTNEVIRTPSPVGDKTLEFQFGTTYEDIQKEFEKYDGYDAPNSFYPYILRNKRIKAGPERWDSSFDPKTGCKFDVIFTYAKEVMQIVLDQFAKQGNKELKLSHVINIQTTDDPKNAEIAADYTLEITQKIIKLQENQNYIDYCKTVKERLDKLLANETNSALRDTLIEDANEDVHQMYREIISENISSIIERFCDEKKPWSFHLHIASY